MGLFRKAAVLTLAVPSVSALAFVALNANGAPSGQQHPAEADNPDQSSTIARVSRAGASATLRPAPARAKFDKGPAFDRGCAKKRGDGKVVTCRFGPADASTSIALFGDSHALQYSPALIALARRKGLRLVTYVRGDCVIAKVNFNPGCNRWRRSALRRIARQKPDQIVVSTSTGNQYVVRRGGRELSRRASEPRLRAGMRKTLRRLTRVGDGKGGRAKVTLLRDQALAPFRPPDCLQMHPRKPSRCAFRTRRPNPPGFDWAAGRSMRKVRVVQPMNYFCGRRWCPAVSGDIVVFRDKYHVTATYARTMAGWLASRLGI